MDFSGLETAVDRVAQDNLGDATVTYQPEVGEAVEVTGIFDERYGPLRPRGSEADIESVGPAVSLLLEDLPSDPRDDEPTVTVGGVAYQVVERQPEGGGRIRLLLHRAGA